MNQRIPSNQDLEARRAAACAPGGGVQTRHFTAHASGSEIWDVEGRRLIDFGSGIAVLATGHRHPRIVAAVERQLQAFHHTCFQVTPYESYVELCEQLNARVPGGFAKKTALFTTGVEAVENAVKVARAATGRSGVISFTGAFHGRTLMGMALTGKVKPYKAEFGTMPGDVWHVPFPAPTLGVSVEESIRALDRLLRTSVDPRRVAAIFIEPVQGEGGFYIAPGALLRHLRAVCDEHGILLVADEIQTGFGRTGRLFAMEHHPVEADLVTMAKSLAGGFPLSALTGRAEWMDAAQPGGLGGTYAGHPLAVAAALEVQRIIEDEGLVKRAEAIGTQLVERLHALREVTPSIREVRALGAMVSMEFACPDTGEPDAAATARVQQAALERGLLLLGCGVHGNVIRFLPALTIADDLLEEGLDALTAAVRMR